MHNIPQHSFERTKNYNQLMFSALKGFYQMNRKKRKEKIQAKKLYWSDVTMAVTRLYELCIECNFSTPSTLF